MPRTQNYASKPKGISASTTAIKPPVSQVPNFDKFRNQARNTISSYGPQSVTTPTPAQATNQAVNNPPDMQVVSRDADFRESAMNLPIASRLSTTKRTMTPATLFHNYYKDIPGGLARAAQWARAYNRSGKAPAGAPDLALENTSLLRNVNQYSSPAAVMNARGFALPAGSDTYIYNQGDRPTNRTLMEHEVTHLLQKGNARKAPWSIPADKSWGPTGWSRWQQRQRGEVPETPYNQQPAEIDAYLVGPIKRLYAKNTGRLVTTPEEAAIAIDWWKKQQAAGHKGRNVYDKAILQEGKYYAPADWITDPDQEGFRNYVRQRMPGIVQTGGMARIGKQAAEISR